MQAFRFRLEKVLRLRERQLTAEEVKLEELLNRRAQMQSEMEELDASLQREQVSIQKQQFVSPAELISLDRYHGRVDREHKEWVSKIDSQGDLIEKQKTQVVEARGRVRLLEKLREKRKAEWKAEGDRELEELAADFSAAQWLRLRDQRESIKDVPPEIMATPHR